MFSLSLSRMHIKSGFFLHRRIKTGTNKTRYKQVLHTHTHFMKLGEICNGILFWRAEIVVRSRILFCSIKHIGGRKSIKIKWVWLKLRFHIFKNKARNWIFLFLPRRNAIFLFSVHARNISLYSYDLSFNKNVFMKRGKTSFFSWMSSEGGRHVKNIKIRRRKFNLCQARST